jgi:hypothetical protein
MVLKKMAAAAVLLAFAVQSAAFDVRDAGPSTMFYISIPLDSGLSAKERQWRAGLQLQGKREYQAVNIDSRVLNFVSDDEIDGKWIIAGLVALGAAAAIGGKDRSTSGSASQPNQQQASPQPCPTPVTDPCAR